MATLTILQAVNQALRETMRDDPDVLVLGEDVGRDGGVFRATEGLLDEFGEERVIDTPLAESGIIGTAVGMAMYGMRPVPEIQFQDFIYPAFDQIVSEAAKMRYRSGGQYTCPMTIRTPVGGGIRGGHYHSQSGESHFIHTAGLKVVMPSTPHDTKGLLVASIRDEDPVLFLEPKRIYRAVRGDVAEGLFEVPIGQARIAQEGTDVTLVTYGAMVYPSLEAAGSAAEQGWSVEVLDLRSLMPWDLDAVLTSVAKTGRLVIVNEAPLHCGFAAEIAAQVAERAIEYLKGPIVRVTGFDTPFPYSLEGVYLPDGPRVLAAIEKVMRFDD